MLPFVEEHVPELLLQRSRIAFSCNLHLERGRERHKATSNLVLARNLKFYEFRRKELLHHIDLKETRLQRFAEELEQYSGPVSNFLPKQPDSVNGQELDCNMLSSPEDLPIQIGKYIWQQDHIYLLLHCWELFLVLRRPKEHGCNFELVAQHLDVASFRMIGGPIPYQAYVELTFGTNGKRLCTDFQEPPLDEGPSTSSSSSSTSKANGCATAAATVSVERLLQQVHSARAELSSQRAQTQQDFARSQDLQAFGPPGQRSLLLEEKQLLRRFGDVWTRICGDYLVCGCLLVNIAGSHRLSIVQELRPLVRLEPAPPPSLSFEHRLYELPLQADGQPPEDYDELAQFWACQEQHTRRLKWRRRRRQVAKGAAAQLPPECSAVLVVRLHLSDLLQAEQLHLMAAYEVRSVQERQQLQAEIRQLHLVSLDARKLLDDMEALAPTFAAATLHQDFLAVIVTQQAQIALRLEFQAAQDCARFEQLLAEKLQFEVIETQAQDRASSHLQLLDDDTCSEIDFQTASGGTASVQQRIFYNRQPLSQWCGILLLRDDPGQHWHVYAPTEARLRLFLQRLMRDLLQLHCNLTQLEVSEHSNNPSPAAAALELEATLGEELQAWAELLQGDKERRVEQLQHIQSLQMASDVLAATVIGRSQDRGGE